MRVLAVSSASSTGSLSPAVKASSVRQPAPLRNSAAPHPLLAAASQALASASLVGALWLGAPVEGAHARSSILPPIDNSDPERCAVSALDKFAKTRAEFSMEAGSGDMSEAFVDVRGCDFRGLDLSSKIFSGVIMENANFEGARIVGTEMSRADARDANLAGVDFTDTNCYSTAFGGANLENAQFENAILTGAGFGKGATGEWANLKGAHFEGALLSSSDIGRMCENPTLDEDTKKFELGCRKARK